MWKPASKLSIEGDAHTYKKTIKQNWKGLVIQDFGGEKGLSKKTFHFSCKGINMNIENHFITLRSIHKKNIEMFANM